MASYVIANRSLINWLTRYVTDVLTLLPLLTPVNASQVARGARRRLRNVPINRQIRYRYTQISTVDRIWHRFRRRYFLPPYCLWCPCRLRSSNGSFLSQYCLWRAGGFQDDELSFDLDSISFGRNSFALLHWSNIDVFKDCEGHRESVGDIRCGDCSGDICVGEDMESSIETVITLRHIL